MNNYAHSKIHQIVTLSQRIIHYASKYYYFSRAVEQKVIFKSNIAVSSTFSQFLKEIYAPVVGDAKLRQTTGLFGTNFKIFLRLL